MRSPVPVAGAAAAFSVLGFSAFCSVIITYYLLLHRLNGLLTSDRDGRTLTRTSVRVRALTANAETLAMTNTPIAAQVEHALDVHARFATKITFNAMFAVDDLAD